jgi:multiple inositol-polyphosphate phosphatase/2,3-bisphosphoglycerate 3-phosphatase
VHGLQQRTTEALGVGRYAEDLKYFYKDGYRNELNSKVGCPPLKNLYKKFEATVNNGNTNRKKMKVFFTQVITVLTFLVVTDIVKDYQPLTAENYNSNAPSDAP